MHQRRSTKRVALINDQLRQIGPANRHQGRLPKRGSFSGRQFSRLIARRSPVGASPPMGGSLKVGARRSCANSATALTECWTNDEQRRDTRGWEGEEDNGGQKQTPMRVNYYRSVARARRTLLAIERPPPPVTERRSRGTRWAGFRNRPKAPPPARPGPA
jgi:hypothetical protein